MKMYQLYKNSYSLVFGRFVRMRLALSMLRRFPEVLARVVAIIVVVDLVLLLAGGYSKNLAYFAPGKLEVIRDKGEKLYSFSKVGEPFGEWNRGVIEEIACSYLEEVILYSVPQILRPRLRRYLSKTLKIAEKYQVDPFWVLAVMWTESHFNPKAKSWAEARGLMQITPQTGKHLIRVMKNVKEVGTFSNKVKLVSRGRRVRKNDLIKFIVRPDVNIEMGVFYLRSLLERFGGNYRFATVAYNMGPGTVNLRLRKKLQVGVKNQYLDKVKRAYNALTKAFRFRGQTLIAKGDVNSSNSLNNPLP